MKGLLFAFTTDILLHQILIRDHVSFFHHELSRNHTFRLTCNTTRYSFACRRASGVSAMGVLCGGLCTRSFLHKYANGFQHNFAAARARPETTCPFESVTLRFCALYRSVHSSAISSKSCLDSFTVATSPSDKGWDGDLFRTAPLIARRTCEDDQNQTEANTRIRYGVGPSQKFHHQILILVQRDGGVA